MSTRLPRQLSTNALRVESAARSTPPETATMPAIASTRSSPIRIGGRPTQDVVHAGSGRIPAETAGAACRAITTRVAPLQQSIGLRSGVGGRSGRALREQPLGELPQFCREPRVLCAGRGAGEPVVHTAHLAVAPEENRRRIRAEVDDLRQLLGDVL